MLTHTGIGRLFFNTRFAQMINESVPGRLRTLRSAHVAHGIAVQSSKLMVRPEIRKVEDLKGKKIGISSLGSAGDLLFGYVLRKYGIDTNREVFWLQALLKGAVDACDLTNPADAEAERRCFRALLDARKEIVYFHGIGGDPA